MSKFHRSHSRHLRKSVLEMFFQHQRSEWSLLSWTWTGSGLWLGEKWWNVLIQVSNSAMKVLRVLTWYFCFRGGDSHKQRTAVSWTAPQLPAMTSPLSVRVSVTTLEHCAATSGETCCYMVQSRMAMSWRKLIFERSLTTNGCFLYSDTCLFWVWNMHVPPQHMEEESGLANCATKMNKWGSTKSPWKLVPFYEPIYCSNKTSGSPEYESNVVISNIIFWFNMTWCLVGVFFVLNFNTAKSLVFGKFRLR